MLTAGGAIAGYWEMGRARMDSAPARISLNLSKARKKTYWYFKSEP